MAAPIPPLLRPERIPRGPMVRYGIDGCAGPAPIVRFVVDEDARIISIAKPWACDRCGATGVGCADDGFAHEEAEHCLTGCNGSLRSSGSLDDRAPALPEADLSLNGLPLTK